MTATSLMTAEDLWAMPEVPGKQFELVDGELVEVPGAGYLPGLIAGMLYRLMFDFAAAHSLGIASHDGTSYILKRRPHVVRVPDTSFVTMDRIPTGRISEGFFDGPPDIAVEVVSPNDLASEVEAKVEEYLDAECVSSGSSGRAWKPSPYTLQIDWRDDSVVLTRSMGARYFQDSHLLNPRCSP